MHPKFADNPLRVGLQRGGIAVGFGIRLARTVEFASLVASCGFDWLFIDLEHSPISLETAAEMCAGALGVGLTPLARVSAGDYHLAARILDSGAWGVLMSHVETSAEAEEMVARLKFPPAGGRSVSYSSIQLGFPARQAGEAAAHFNEQVLLVAMLESPRAIENAAAIGAVPGVDALFVGTNDLSMELGIPGEFGHPQIAAAYERVVAACRQHGKWPGMGGVYAEDLLRRYIGMGMRMILGGTDFALMMESARQRAEMVRRCATNAGV